MKKFVGILSLAGILTLTVACGPLDPSSTVSSHDSTSSSIIDSAKTEKILKLLSSTKTAFESALSDTEIYNLQVGAEFNMETRDYDYQPNMPQSNPNQTQSFYGRADAKANVDLTTAAKVAEWMKASEAASKAGQELPPLPSMTEDRTEFRGDLCIGMKDETQSHVSEESVYIKGLRYAQSTKHDQAEAVVSGDIVAESFVVDVYTGYNVVYGAIKGLLSANSVDQLQEFIVSSAFSLFETLRTQVNYPGLNENINTFMTVIKTVVAYMTSEEVTLEEARDSIISLIVTLSFGAATTEQITSTFGVSIENILKAAKDIDLDSFFTLTVTDDVIGLSLNFDAIETELIKFIAACQEDIVKLILSTALSPEATVEEIAIARVQIIAMIGQYMSILSSMLTQCELSFTLSFTNGVFSGVDVDVQTANVTTFVAVDDPTPKMTMEVIDIAADLNFAVAKGAIEITPIVVPAPAA